MAATGIGPYQWECHLGPRALLQVHHHRLQSLLDKKRKKKYDYKNKTIQKYNPFIPGGKMRSDGLSNESKGVWVKKDTFGMVGWVGLTESAFLFLTIIYIIRMSYLC